MNKGKGIKIIEEIKKIEKAILLNDKIDEMEKKFEPLGYICSSPLGVSGLLFVFYFINTEFYVEHELISFFIIPIYIFLTVLISVVIITKITNYLAKRQVYKDETNKEEKYMRNSKDELIKLKDEHIEKLIDLSMTDCELFHFILLNINDNNLTKELLPYYYKNKTLKVICENTELLSIIKELPINNKTESLILKVQQFLEIEERKEKRSETFENAINKKMGNKIRII